MGGRGGGREEREGGRMVGGAHVHAGGVGGRGTSQSSPCDTDHDSHVTVT